ncbi:MAG: hypothetical protein ACRDGM_05880 [bacterium]
MNLTQVVTALIPALNSDSLANLVWWSETELYQWLDEGAQAICRATGLLAETDSSITVVPGTAIYNLPARHLSSIATFAQAAPNNIALRESSLAELEALSSTWPTDEGNFLERVAHQPGAEQATFYPLLFTGRPNEVVEAICYRYPSTISSGSPTVNLPEPLRDYFFFRALGEARGKEGEARMQEVAKSMRHMADTMAKVAVEYWGPAL